MRKTYRTNKNFDEKLDAIKKHYKDNDIYMSVAQLFDEMIDLYYTKIMIDENELILSEQLELVVINVLNRFTEINAQMFNAVLEEIKKKK